MLRFYFLLCSCNTKSLTEDRFKRLTQRVKARVLLLITAGPLKTSIFNQLFVYSYDFMSSGQKRVIKSGLVFAAFAQDLLDDELIPWSYP